MPKPLRKLISFVFFIICIHPFTIAQYTDKGNGALKNEIWWFDWAGMDLINGDSKTITLPDGLVVTYSYSGSPTKYPQARIMNTWMGAVLHLLYDFTNPAIRPALYHTTPNIETLTFTINVTAARNGVPVPFTFVAADAEASNTNEVINLSTSGSPWQAIDFFRNSGQTTNPLRDCNTPNIYISDTYGGSAQRGQNPIIASTTTTGQIGVYTVLDHQIFGGMGIAFGIMAPIDRGDLPASFGTVQHGLTYNYNNGCNYLPPLPAATQSQSLKLGAVTADADGIQTLDDNAAGADEDGVSVFQAYTYNGSYPVQVSLANTTGSDAWLTGWLDHNRNGVFDNGESVTVLVPNNATTATLTWTGLPTYLPASPATDYAFRLRLSSDRAATMNAAGYAMDGEVEDYFIPAKTLCTISLQTINDITVCGIRSIQLTTNTTGVTTYSWDNSAFLSSTTIADPVAMPASTSRYIVTGSNPQGCEAKDTVTITVNPGPVITINNDTTICIGASVQLSANAPGVLRYTWSPQATLDNNAISTPVATPLVTTTYKIEVEAANGCINEDSVTINLLPPAVFAANAAKAILCGKDSVLLTASGGDEYTWLAEDGSLLGRAASLMAKPDFTQVYEVLIKENTCNTTDIRRIPIVVNDNPIPVVTKSNDIDCSTGQAFLQAGGGINYTWDVTPGLRDINTANPTVTPTQTTTYYVSITNSKGCSVKDSVTVLADFTKAISTNPVPTAFTPNNDGRNDCFGLKKWGLITELQFQVFNRWGERVFSTTDPSHCWDGRYKGVLQPAGGYAYLIKAVTRCGSVNRSGMVMLIR